MIEMASTITKELWEVWTEMFSAFISVLPKAFYFSIWIICGIFILPCVYISAVFFPMWTDWGENI
ncbi:MAG: hypothetical protein WC666_03725 [Candidatus Paceibacterota bacterium]|jgi:hypothetical protein